MPPRSAEEKARRKAEYQQRLEARRLKKEKEEEETKRSVVQSKEDVENEGDSEIRDKECYLVTLPEDPFHHLLSFLPARELGCLSMTCRDINLSMGEARTHHLFSRLNTKYYDSDVPGKLQIPIKICENENQTKELLSNALDGCGDTGRLVTKRAKKEKGTCADEYIAFARFIEEAVLGRSVQKCHGQKPSLLPPVVNGRFASASPEHSLCRAGGGERSGAGGSGTASWGVGRRGQLGHGKRKDERNPQLLLGGIGYGIRIVQVSAGGGLVRVAHSLLLTSTGQVLSFGCAQYGQLGHGYDSGKQLPDKLRPQYVGELSHLQCTCVSAGELHSAVVTSDGDVYSWGDGFCGQLGLGDKRPQLTPQLVTKNGFEDECVLSVSCGARHTLCVTEDGEVFSFGLGHFGVLGRSFTPYETYSTQAISNMGVDMEGEEQQLLGHINTIDDEMRIHLDLLANVSLDDTSDQCFPKIVDSLQGVCIVSASAGHRHSLFLDSFGGVYSCGSGYGPSEKQEIPMKVMEFVEDDVQIMQMSAGVDISMVVSTTGDVYSWGKAGGGRIGLNTDDDIVSKPRMVTVKNSNGSNVKAVDVECGYVHSMIVGCDGSLFMCGGVGIDGDDDGQNESEFVNGDVTGEPRQVQDFNIWHRLKEPKEDKHKVAWKKYGKYELKGRSAMMSESEKWK